MAYWRRLQERPCPVWLHQGGNSMRPGMDKAIPAWALKMDKHLGFIQG